MNLFIDKFEPYPFAAEKYGHAQFGWAGGMDAPGGGNGGGGAWLKLEPTALHVRDHDGVETTVLVSDPQAAAMRGMAVPAIAAAGVGVVLMIVARLMRGR